MDSDSKQAYEITFLDGRKMRCSKVGPVEYAAIDAAVRSGERVKVTIAPIAGPQMMVVLEEAASE